jgi:hypothetical protein
MQQHMLKLIQNQLGVTNETDWSAIQPLVQKVMDAQRAARGNMGRLFGRGGPGGPGGGDRQSDPAADTLQKAIDGDAPAEQIKNLLTKYKSSQTAKRAALAAAQEDLRSVLVARQEAQATLLGLLNWTGASAHGPQLGRSAAVSAGPAAAHTITAGIEIAKVAEAM